VNDSEPEPALPAPLVLDNHAGPAARITRERAAAMVEAAVLGFDRAAPARPRRQFGPLLVIAASVLLALVGGAAAARYYFQFGRPQGGVQAPEKGAPQARDQTASRAVAKSQPIPAPAPLVTESPSEPAPLPAAAKTARPALAERTAPEDLLQRANHLRSAGQFREAAQTYTLVYDRFPKSLSAYVARVAAAAIELEHLSNPTRARRLYEQALREQPQAALDLEARQGLSVALRDLEDRPAETRALRALVAAHPDSPAARRAQVRLRELGGASP
jgi:tetratricopeptide (TPR) repeat protein